MATSVLIKDACPNCDEQTVMRFFMHHMREMYLYVRRVSGCVRFTVELAHTEVDLDVNEGRITINSTYPDNELEASSNVLAMLSSIKKSLYSGAYLLNNQADFTMVTVPISEVCASSTDAGYALCHVQLGNECNARGIISVLLKRHLCDILEEISENVARIETIADTDIYIVNYTVDNETVVIVLDGAHGYIHVSLLDYLLASDKMKLKLDNMCSRALREVI